MAKVSLAQEREILVKASEGMSSGAIAAWLGSEHGVKITGAAIRARLAQTKEERGTVSKAVAREVLVKCVTSDLDSLENERRRCQRLARRVFRIATDCSEGTVNSEAADLYLRVLDRVVKMVDLRLHYSGADAPPEGETGGVELPDDPAKRAAVLRALAERADSQAAKR